MKTGEYESLRRLNKKDAPNVLTGQDPCGIMGKLPKPGDPLLLGIHWKYIGGKSYDYYA